jgi:hypothetical protein
MDPGPRLTRSRRDIRDRVDGAGVHVSGLETDDGRAFEETAGESIGPHAAASVDGKRRDALPSEPEQAQRLQERRMDLGAHHHAYLGSSEQTSRLDVPSFAGEQMVACRRESGKVPHGGAGDEPSAPIPGKRQELPDPGQRYLFESRVDRRADGESAVLIPCAREQVAGDARGNGAAGHETEVPRTGAGDGGRRTDLVEESENLFRGARTLGQRNPELLKSG